MAHHNRMPRWARWTLSGMALTAALFGSWTQAAEDEKPAKEVAAALKGHTDPVYSIAFSPNGKYVATASWDWTLKLWNARTGKELKTFGGQAGHRQMVLSVAFHPDGHSLASGSSDNTAKIWDVPSDSPLTEFAHKAGVNAIALSPDGKFMAAGTKDGTVQLWKTADGRVLFTLTGHKGAVTNVAFAANGQVLVSSGRDKTLRFWNTTTGKQVGRIGAHEGGVNTVVISPNNNAAAYTAGPDGTVKIWQIAPLPTSRSLPAHEDAVTCLALANNGNQVLSGGADAVVRLCNFSNGQVIKEFSGAKKTVRAVAAAPNGAMVAAGTADKRLLVWNANDGKLIGRVVAHAKPVNGVAFHPQGKDLVTAGGDGVVKVWLTPLPATSLTHPDAVLSAALTGDGKRLFTGGADKILRSWNVANKQMDRQFSGHSGEVTAVAVTSNGQLLASGGADNTIRFWNQNTGKETQNIGGHTGPVTSLAFSPNGQQLLSSSEDGTVKLWQLPLAAGKSLLHADQVTSLALSSDGTKLLTGCNDKQVQLWNVGNGQSMQKFSGLTEGIASVAMNPKGEAVAAGGTDKALIIWNANNAQVIKKITLDAVAQGIAFSPDGKHLAAALADKSIRLFDAAMGKQVKSFTGHTGAVNAVAFTPKGDRLISGSADKTVRVWDIAAGSSKMKMEHEGAVTCLAVNKDGTRVVAGGKDKTATVWKLADGTKVTSITTPAAINGLGLSAKIDRIVAGGSDNLVRVYGMDGKLVEFFAHEGSVLAVAFDEDGKRVVSASADKTARVWTSSLVWQKNRKGAVRQAMFSPKGDQVVATAGKMLRVWNAADGKEIKTIAAHKKSLVGAGISADGSLLVSAGADNSVKVWNLTPRKGGKKEEDDQDKPVADIALPSEPQSVTLSPNGSKVAVALAAKASNPIHVFNVATGKELLVISDHTDSVPALQFQADNRTLVSVSKDKTSRLSDVGVTRVIEAHKGAVVGVEYDAQGTTLLTGGADKTVKLWEASTGKLQRTFVPLDDSVAAVAFSRDYTRVGAAAGKIVKVWNVANGKELLSLTHPAKVTSLSFSSDKAKIITGAADNLARVWDASTGQELEFIEHDDGVRAVAFHPNNTAVISAGADKVVAVNTLALARVIPAIKGSIRELGLANGGSQILTAGSDKTVELWSLANGKHERSFRGAAGGVNAVAASRNNILVAAGGADKKIRVYNFNDAKLLGVFKAGGAVRALAFSPNSQTLAAVCADKTLVTYNVIYNQGQPVPPDFGKMLQTFTHGQAATSVEFAADNMTIYTGSADKSVRAWKVAAEAPTKNFQHPNFVDVVAFNSNGTQLATACHDGIVRIFDVAKGQVVRQITAHKKPNETAIYSLSWSPDDKLLLTAGQDYTLNLWNATTGALVREFKAYKEKTFEKGHQDSVYGAALSPDGKWIASGAADGVIKIWNAADGTVVRDLVNPEIKVKAKEPAKSHPGKVYHLRFTKDGKHLVSTGEARFFKGYLAIWNMPEGKLAYGKEMAWGTFYGAALSPDGKRLALACGADSRDSKTLNSCYIIKMPSLGKQK